VRYDEIGTDRGEWYVKRFVSSRRILSRVQEESLIDG
jgi:hypothetical protein